MVKENLVIVIVIVVVIVIMVEIVEEDMVIKIKDMEILNKL